MSRYNPMSKFQGNLEDRDDWYQFLTTESERYERPDFPPPIPEKRRPEKPHQSSSALYRSGEESVTFENPRFAPTTPQANVLLTNSKNPDLLTIKAPDETQNIEFRRKRHYAPEIRHSGCSICYWFCLITMYLLICVAMAFLVLHVYRPRALTEIGITFEHDKTPEMTKMSDYTINQMKILEVLRVVQVLQNKMCYIRKIHKNDTYTKTCDDFIIKFRDLACLTNLTCV